MIANPISAQPAQILTELSDEIEIKLCKMPAWRVALIFSPPSLHASHSELYRDAVGMIEAGLTAEEQFQVLTLRFSGYYRKIEDREIEDAIRSASGETQGIRAKRERLPLINEKLRKGALENTDFCNLESLKKASTESCPWRLSSAEVLDRFFRPGELVCMAETKQTARTYPRVHFRGKETDFPFMVPNPMLAQWGTNSVGRKSSRCNSIVGPLRHLVVEFDTGTQDEQASLIGNITRHGVPLLMVLWSGGKSLHSWFDISQVSEMDREKLRRYAAAIGADRATFVPCQLCRTPNATRKENGNKQQVLLLNAGAPSEAKS
jgi:hypothetical protein